MINLAFATGGQLQMRDSSNVWAVFFLVHEKEKSKSLSKSLRKKWDTTMKQHGGLIQYDSFELGDNIAQITQCDAPYWRPGLNLQKDRCFDTNIWRQVVKHYLKSAWEIIWLVLTSFNHLHPIAEVDRDTAASNELSHIAEYTRSCPSAVLELIVRFNWALLVSTAAYHTYSHIACHKKKQYKLPLQVLRVAKRAYIHLTFPVETSPTSTHDFTSYAATQSRSRDQV